jgi:protein-S-isoprenylcysteine O-methyltransferase Ste14
MTQFLALAYGLAAYAVFLGTFVYAIAFVGTLPVPKTIDSGSTDSLLTSLAIDAALLGLFAVQHSVMARPAFKRWWTQIVSPSIERSTYVLFSSIALILLFWQWRPVGSVLWDVTGSTAAVVINVLYWFGWLGVLTSTFLINHFDLFGLRQVYSNFVREPYKPLPFSVRGFYRIVRHPIMLGFIVAFWATPRMTVGHLVFAIATTAYILIALQLEEHDLAASHGEDYEQYRRETPMLLPIPRRAVAGDVAEHVGARQTSGR